MNRISLGRYACLLLFLALFMGCGVSKVQPEANVYVSKDTSFTIQSAYIKELKKYPFIKVAEAVPIAGVTVRRDVKYKSSSPRQLFADIYSPQDTRKTNPAILLIHGGGWKSGDKTQMAAMAWDLADKGFVAVSVEHRLTPEAKYPAGLQDLRSAIQWLGVVAPKLRIDTSRIAVLGVSAGGQLAALLGTTQYQQDGDDKQFIKIKAIVDIDGILAFHHPESQEGQSAAEWLGGTYEELTEVWAAASPLTHADAKTPSILFLNSQNVRFHAGREDMLAKIKPFGIYSEVHTIPDTPHTFWLFHPWFEPTMTHIVGFLNKTFEYDGTKI